MLHEIHPRFCSSESLACISLVCSSRGVTGPAGPRLRVPPVRAPVAAAAPARGGSGRASGAGRAEPGSNRAVLPARRWPRRPAATGDRDGCTPRRGSDRPGRPTAWTPRAAPSRRGASAAGQGTGSAGARRREAPRWWPWPRAGRVCRGRRWLSRAGARRVGLQRQGLWGRARRLGGHPR